MRAHQEARQSIDLRKDLARRVMPSDGPYQKGDRVFVWHKDESKKKSEGVWVRGTVISQEGAMVLVEVHRSVLRVNQSKVRRDGDPWHDVAIPLKPVEQRGSSHEEVRGDAPRCSSQEEALERIGDRLLEQASSRFCYEHEICFHSLTSGKSDFVEITPQLTGLTACTCHSGRVASEPVLFGEWSAKKIQSSIESAWQVILAAEPNHIIIHPVIPEQWTKKAAAAFWHFCAEVTRWQDDRGDGYLVTIMYPAYSGFWLSQSSRSLKWRSSMTFCTFKNKGEQQHGQISFLTNASEGSLDRLGSLEEGYSSEKTLDPRFAVLLSQCLLNNHGSDLRQGFLFEDIFEDFDDGTLCALCLRSERNSEALPVLPSSEEYSMLSDNSRGKLPKPLQFVAPQRFVTSSLVQALSYIDNLLPGVELEIHTTTSAEAVALRPMIKNVRVLTLPYLEFEFCNVYRGTQGKTFPLIHRHPDAVVLLWCKGDYDHVFFVTVAQLLPCLQDMNLADWSMVVFWNESTGSGSKKGPDVGLDFTDQPAPSPHVPQQPPVTPGDDLDYPGYDDPHVDMPVDDEDMPPPNSAPEPDLNDDPIELGSGGNPPPRPPGGGTHVPVPGGDGDEDLDMPHDPDADGGHPPGSGPQGPGPGYGPSPDEPALPMEYHEESPPPGGPPDAPGAPPQYANPDHVLSPPMPWPAPPSQIVPFPIPPHPQVPVPHSLRPPSPRNVSSTRARGQHPDDTSKRRSRGQSWDRQWCCCLVSRLGRRIPLLRVTSRVVMNLLLRRLHRHRFRVCQSLREISLFSKRHFRRLPRNLLCLQMGRIRIRTRLLTIVGIPCLPWLLVTTKF